MSFFSSMGRIGRSSRQKKESARPPIPQLPSNNSQHGGQAYGQGNGFAIPQQHHQQHQVQQQQPQRPPPLYLCRPYVQSALVKGSFATIVVLPKFIEQGEWLALNLFEFFTHLNHFYSVVSERCTPQTCPSMSAGYGIDYTWLDQNGKQMRLPASQYIDYVLAWINNRVNEEGLFPTKAGQPFSPQFLPTCKAIAKQLFRVFAHVYHAHFDTLLHLGLEAHWNSFFQHFVCFGKEFELLDGRDVEPLAALIQVFQQQGNIQ